MSSLSSPSTSVVESGNAFKGLAYYDKDDAARFAGRQRDIEAVANGILRNRTFVLYGRSGLGKTSLLLAGVLPRLADSSQRCRTIYVRVLEDPLDDLRRALAKEAAGGLKGPEPNDLRGMIERAGRTPDGHDHLVVVAFDQFEEFFVRFADQPDPAGGIRTGEELDRRVWQRRVAQRQDFIREIGRLAAAPELNLRLVFSLREDWMAQMGDFSGAIPEITKHVHRLLPLTSLGVRQTIVDTLRAAGAVFDGRLISALVDSLSEVQFDPTVLQVLCSEVWDKARARNAEKHDPAVQLGLEDLEAVGGLRKVFRGFLDQIDHEIEPSDLRRRIQIRAVLDALISDKRTKLAASRESLLHQYFAISDGEIDELLDRLYRLRLLRRDPRGGQGRFELVHERLIGLILEWLDTDLEFFKFRSARNLVVNSCHNRGWRINPELLLNRGQLDDTVGPFKDLLNFNDEERLFLVSSAIFARSRDLEHWAALAGYGTSSELLDSFLDQKDNERVRERAAESAGRVAGERAEHFAERCLDLALHDESSAVRQAAARSFAELASRSQFQALAAELGTKRTRKAALDLLVEVVDKDRVPSEIRFGRRLWQARRKLFRRKLEAARRTIRERSRRGTLIGLVAALVWSATGGALLLWILVNEVSPDLAIKGGGWALEVGLYALLALPLGTFVGWTTARRTAREAVRRGREGAIFRALGFGIIPQVCWVIGLFALNEHSASGRLLPALAIPLAIVGIFAWSALIALLAWPAVRTDPGRRGPWIWGWLWAFGGSMIVPMFLWPHLETFTIRTGSFEPVTLVSVTTMTIAVFLILSTAIGGLLVYAGLLAMALSPSESNLAERSALGAVSPRSSAIRTRASKGVGALVSVAALGLVVHYFGWDSFPFLTPRQVLGDQKIELPLKARGPIDTVHLELTVPEQAEGSGAEGGAAPRLAKISIPGNWHAYVRGWGELQSGAYILQPGERLLLAFKGHQSDPGMVEILPDRALTNVAATDPRFVVVRLRAKNGTWSGYLPGLEGRQWGRRPLYLTVGDFAQGGRSCGQAGLVLRLRGAGEPRHLQLGLRCGSGRMFFGRYEERCRTGAAAPELMVGAWQPESVLSGGDRAIFSPDGVHVVALARSGFDLRRRAANVDFMMMQHYRGSRTISRADNEMFFVDEDETKTRLVEVWKATGERVILRHPSRVERVTYSPDGRFLVTVAEAIARIWRADGSGSPILLRHPQAIGALEFSRDGTRLVTGCRDNVLRVWRVGDAAEPIAAIPLPGDLRYFRFSPDGAQIAGVTSEGVWILKADGSRDKPILLAGSAKAGGNVEDSPDATYLKFDDRDNGTALIWNTFHPGTPFTLKHLPKSEVEFSPDGTRILTVSPEGFIEISQADGSGQPMRLPQRLTTEEWQFSQDGGRILTVGIDGLVRVWQIDSPIAPVILKGQARAQHAGFSPDGNRILMVDHDGHASLWRTNGFGGPTELPSSGHVRGARFSPDGSYVATVADSDTVTVWPVNGTSEPMVLRQPAKVSDLEFSSDGSRLLTNLFDSDPRVWNIAVPLRPRAAGDLFLFLRVSLTPASERETDLDTLRQGEP